MSDLIERAAWTFGQAFAAAVLASLADVTSIATFKAALIAGAAAGLSALKTAYVQSRANAAA